MSVPPNQNMLQGSLSYNSVAECKLPTKSKAGLPSVFTAQLRNCLGSVATHDRPQQRPTKVGVRRNVATANEWANEIPCLAAKVTKCRLMMTEIAGSRPNIVLYLLGLPAEPETYATGQNCTLWRHGQQGTTQALHILDALAVLWPLPGAPSETWPLYLSAERAPRAAAAAACAAGSHAPKLRQQAGAAWTRGRQAAYKGL